jgi:hypothetical protein
MLKIFNIKGAIIIGKQGTSNGNPAIILKSPRLLIPENNVVHFVTFIGNPEEIIINHKDVVWHYEPEDTNIKQTYAQSVSGLVQPINNIRKAPFEIIKN